ncbi:MAG: exodeoxyribonuclease III, partial [Myxococcota bacterium]|nr:exodeoxyribonuclease III [Myxococcota bacterium]
MKICTWNVNSLKARQEYVSLFLDEVAPDVLCIQELKLETDKVPREMFESRGYDLAIHGQKQWNGVLIASKSPLEDVHTGLPLGDMGQSRLVAATTGGLRFVNLYCPQGQAADSP